MGSDLVVAGYSWPVTEGGEPATVGPALAAEMKRRWESASAETKGTVAEWSCSGTESEAMSAVDHLVDEAISAFFSTDQWPRDVTRLRVSDTQLLFVSGGMTGGDDPTESYAAVMAIAISGITDTPVPVGRDPHTASVRPPVGTRWVVQELEGGVIQDAAADERVEIISFDFDEILEGGGTPDYISEGLASLASVPSSSDASGLATALVARIVREVQRCFPDRSDLMGLAARYGTSGGAGGGSRPRP
jgi:hypothetical protein